MIVSLVSAATATAFLATRALSLALFEISRMEAIISSLPAATTATFFETSSLAAETTLACVAVSSALPAICWLTGGQFFGGRAHRSGVFGDLLDAAPQCLEEVRKTFAHLPHRVAAADRDLLRQISLGGCRHNLQNAFYFPLQFFRRVRNLNLQLGLFGDIGGVLHDS